MCYQIIRGASQIGGTITEIYSNTTRIWIDFGAELSADADVSTDAAMIEEISRNPPDAVIFSHAHGDHVGLLYAIPDAVSHIYIGRVAARLLLNIWDYLLRLPSLSPVEREKLEREKSILEDTERMRYYEDGEAFIVGDIMVTPYEVDHSICDAYMFMIEVQGKHILHTGDFRNHGRLGSSFLDRLKAIVQSHPVDILITEGTMMSRGDEDIMTEEQLSDKALALLQEHKYAFLVCSSTNMDSLSSFYYAMIRSGFQNGDPDTGIQLRKPAFIVDSYVKAQINVFSKSYGEARGMKAYNFHRTYTIKDNLNGHIGSGGMRQIEYMEQNGFLMRVNTGTHSRKLMERLRHLNPIVIYSMWDGYLDPAKPYRNEALIEMQKAWPNAFYHLHTSGHADKELLEKVIRIVNPREALVPVHTENAGGFYGLDIGDESKARIQLYR